MQIGDGTGTYFQTVSGSDVIVSVGDGKITLSGAANLSVVNIAGVNPFDIVGTEGNDSIANSLNGATIQALGGNDYIRNYGANVSIDGGAGNDYLYNEGANVTIDGGAGNDKLYGGTGNDSLTGGSGDDLFIYSAGNDVITDYAAGDKISLGAAISKTSLSGSDATFTIGSNTLKVKNGKGKEIAFINADGNEQTIIGGAYLADDNTKSAATLASWREVGDATARTTGIKITGNAKANTILGGSGKDTLYGKDGADYLVGNAGSDKLYGDNGDDTLWGDTGNDTLTGGKGADLFVYTSGNDVIADYAAGDKISIGAAITNTSLSGSDATFTIGSNTLKVKNGKGKEIAFINADGNEQTIIGGAYLADDNTKSAATLASWREVGDATARTAGIKITGNAKANTILGGSGKDTLYGKDGADYLVGNAGSDKLYGDNGNDTLWGDTGNDTLTGGKGADLFVYTSGNDVIADYAAGDKISIGAAITNTSLSGSDATFTIGSNTLKVKNGKGKEIAFINTDGTEQTIIGGAYLADDNTKSAATLASWRKVADATARTTGIKITGNSLANTILGGSGKDTLYGKDGNDYLSGGSGVDKLYGGNGNDTLIGGSGNDSLWGESGADTFIYANGDGKDVISGFANDDMLQITGTFSASLNSAGNVVFKVGSTASAITLKNFTATTFNINGNSYQISGTKLVKK